MICTAMKILPSRPRGLKGNMLKKLVITLVGLVILIGLPTLIKLSQFSAMASAQMQMPPETVTAVAAKKEHWPNSIN